MFRHWPIYEAEGYTLYNFEEVVTYLNKCSFYHMRAVVLVIPYTAVRGKRFNNVCDGVRQMPRACRGHL